ncbi:hypothetical protein HGRIS_003399 [Hohenbuehelia grisea]|uniref:Uncharacterized protein n=1 Tax=Hohenbuehelia grisea TaxID=104357 RepID=A0ABR3JGB5_9AGAR
MIIPINLAPSGSNPSLPSGLANISHDEVVLIELQGALEVESAEPGERNGKLVGTLRIDDKTVSLFFLKKLGVWAVPLLWLFFPNTITACCGWVIRVLLASGVALSTLYSLGFPSGPSVRWIPVNSCGCLYPVSRITRTKGRHIPHNWVNGLVVFHG